MSRTITLEVDAKHEALVRQAVALVEEMEQLALTAAEGTVLQACEEAVIEKGRRLQSQVLAAAVTRRLEAVEKKGLPCVPVHVDGRKKTKAPKNGS
jgi:flagellar biosynthesis/type III secretory pathway protein FliH